MFSIIRKKEGVLKAKNVYIPTIPSTSASWTQRKARAKAAVKLQGLLHRRGTGSAMRGGKENAQKGISANTNSAERPGTAKGKSQAQSSSSSRCAEGSPRNARNHRQERRDFGSQEGRTTRTLRKLKPNSRLCITIAMQKTPRANLLDGQVRLRYPRSTCGFRRYLTTT